MKYARILTLAALTAALAFGQPAAGKGKGRGGPGGGFGGRGGPGGAPGGAPAVPSQPCDRQCLIDIANQYFAALVAHDPAKAPMAANAKFVENVKRLKVGEGLWQTAAAAPASFKILVPDPVSEEVGFIVVMKEKAPAGAAAAGPGGPGAGKGGPGGPGGPGVAKGGPGGAKGGPGGRGGAGAAPAIDADGNRDLLLGGRLRIVNKQITEAEHLTAAANNGNLKTPRPGLLMETPAGQREDRETLLGAARGYYDALDNSMGALAPFADDCERHENGMVTTTNTQCAAQLDTHAFDYITTINNRRVQIADPVTGLALGFSHFRHPMEQKIFKIYNKDGTVTTRDMSNQKPFDMPAAHLFHVTGGKIHEIEAVGVLNVPLNSPTGWE